MRFLADENIPSETVKALRGKGIDIVSILDFAQGLEDERVLSIAYEESRILITFDRDFGELVFRRRARSHGVILLRFTPRSPEDLSMRIETLISVGISFEDHFLVVTEDKVRVIPLRC
jgi:predicted nuclease of predicted toxin-antitoxin system